MPRSEFEQNLEKYAEVIVKIGLNIQPNQRLIIGPRTPIEAAPLVRIVTRKAYQAGARYVDVIWDDEQLSLIRFQHAPRNSFEEVSAWQKDALLTALHRGDARLAVYAQDPDLLGDQDPELVSTMERARRRLFKEVNQIGMSDVATWLVVSAPVPGWSAKVLPDVPVENRESQMWDTIFKMCRVDQDDPIAGWQMHLQELNARSDYLNHKHYSSLKYTAPGTKLSVGLPEGHIWRGGDRTSRSGIVFTANIPEEEILTMPHKDKIEGVVTASKPLNLNGVLIDNFCLTFEAGQVVNAFAAKGEASLRRLLETDEGARRLGEVALVPHSSPIAQSGIVFYNTLFDEKAANHLALGRAYPFTMQDGVALSNDDFAKAGGNQSLIHVDFMIGSGEMDVDGVTESGTVEPVMRQGEWAFDVA